MNPPRLLPAHGPMIDQPAALLDGYLVHRSFREAQIRAALAAGCTSAEEIVARIYPRLSPGLVTAARESVLAHLQYLQEEER